jgi:hypothetical protein
MEKIDFDTSSPLQVYAYRWLEKEGFLDKDAPYDGMLGKAVLELIKAFSKQGHSGFSAGATRELFNMILKDFESGKEV